MKDALALGLLPAALALCALLVRDLKALRHICVTAAVAQLALSLWVAVPVLLGAQTETFLSWFRLDGMAAWIVLVNALVYVAAVLSTAQHLASTDALHVSDKGARALFGLSSLFIVAANAVVSAQDLGVVWVAMEATTLVTAPLILLHGTKRSIEAAWKYLILCGVGIAFALLGTVLLLASAGEQGELRLAWLQANATSLKPSLLGASFVCFLLGYGTKAGLFPVHNWLPDAHSEAPAPASALLSGALLNCAMTALWRIGGVLEASDSRALLTTLLAPMGAATVLAASVMLVRQNDLKRMWAYSSIENMGVLAVAAGLRLGPIFALHALAHSLAKASAFLLSGNVVASYGTVALNRLSGVMRSSPSLGFALLAAGAAVMGAPPFASFVSEWLLLSSAAQSGHWGLMAALVAGFAISFVAVLCHLGRVVFGERQESKEARKPAGSVFTPVLLLFLSALAFFAVTPLAIDSIGRAIASGAGP